MTTSGIPQHGLAGERRHLLLTAGPTQEPIDEVRYLGNRSSGRLGVALADAAAGRGWRVTLLLGPTTRTPADSRVNVRRFRTTAELQALLTRFWPDSHVLVMAAAVADFRPVPDPAQLARAGGKLRRGSGWTLHLEPTPDLLQGCAATRRTGQVLVGFALEPESRLEESAREKLERKGLDLIVANRLETMDAEQIDAKLFGRGGLEASTNGPVSKTAFADWLLDRIDAITPR